ncbi:class I SAM-dependent methyltransferase SCDLUD_002247 [Saccharomycodes ludwigii]|uniref:class I SAM-dependent methyltransferase n=1 Tax=Saccharomycodes ludwigii TaxID=36035 RepID=UPI001E85C3F3|nr:hypothetical protein SCDLUD_002247 [Saccharomycodes ludwigii]KAH3900794.1 hypothetical protein SCDLUD_002247 [Saccharomycodes ludwigii]
MSTFADQKFDSKHYKDNRPTYPESLYNAILSYHKGERETAVDVGCGTGIGTFPLLKYFHHVIGTDPSSKMLEPANELKKEFEQKNTDKTIKFLCCKAENLSSVLPPDSVDLITCAEAIHWFDTDKFFKEAYKVLKTNGTLAIWAYVEPRFLDYPKANEIYEKFVFDDDRYMGPCWQQPGKSYLRNFCRDIKLPTDLFSDVIKIDYVPMKSNKKTAFQIARDDYTMADFRKYLYSWSAYHNWQQKYGEKGKNIADMFVGELKEEFGWTDDTKLRVEWGTFYILARK